MSASLQPLSDIEERIELLKMTLGMFAPGEPQPIADELVTLSEDVLRHFLRAAGLAPAADGNGLAALQRQAAKSDPALAAAAAPCEALLRLRGEIAGQPEHAETGPRLQAAADAAGQIYAVAAARIAARATPASGGSKGTPGGGRIAAFLLAAAMSFLSISSGFAEEVSTRYRGLTLLGNLELAGHKGLEDGVALIVHGTLAHARMEIVADLQKNLKARGLSTLAITLSLGEDRRTGMFDCTKLQNHQPYDSLDEIDAWIGWLKNNGASDVVLIGHSQGGNQVAVYGVERRDPSVSALVLMAPATFDFARVAEAYKARYDSDLPALLDKAKALVQAGQGVQRIENIGFLTCANATATADSVVGWYTPSPLRDTPTILPRVPVRTLVIVAGADEVVPDLAAAAAPLARAASPGKPEIAVRTVDGADHFFRDLNNEDAADLIAEFLNGGRADQPR